VLTLSDVVSGDPAAIGSGPAAADATTVEDAFAIARRHGLAPLAFTETVKPGDPVLARVRTTILATPLTLVTAGQRALEAAGLVVRARETLVTGSLEAWAQELGTRARALAAGEAFVAVGEPTVAVRGSGEGGRAQHLALIMAQFIAGTDVAFVACGSDGSDGPTAAAGAVVDGASWKAGVGRGLDPEGALARFDSYGYFCVAGGQIATGPTGTNLTDLFLLARGA
jgi:glycerate 2-kinase